MVLQRGEGTKIYGWASPSERVSVTILNKSYRVRADNHGVWEITLDPLPPGGPYEMYVLGNNLVTFSNIMIGDVWVCGGQSNMGWPVKDSQNSGEEIHNAKFPNIRVVSIAKEWSYKPKDNLETSGWEEVSPETIDGFSAVGYFFGRFIHQEEGVPIGLVSSNWGGTRVETWMPREKIREFSGYGEKLREMEASRPPSAGEIDRQTDGKPYLWLNKYPSLLYDAMIAPLTLFNVKGIIWYQGESNAGEAFAYQKLFPAMINSWREAWGKPKMPFLFVQLANYGGPASEPSESAWAELRESQAMVLDKLPNTGMAVTIDIGEAGDIHPRNKQDVGRRLGLAAQKVAYGKNITFSGPVFKNYRIEGSRVIIKFDHVGKGLVSSNKYGYLEGFSIAGQDQKFVWAKGFVSGKDEVTIYHDSVSAPISVRYAWADNPADASLYNMEGLPAAPFRTDNWPGTTDKVSFRPIFLPLEKVDTANMVNKHHASIAEKAPPLAKPWPSSLQEWEGQKSFYRGKLLESLGFSEKDLASKVPLNARVVKKPLEFPDYTVYHLVYQSMPKLWVTANLYVPKGRQFPAPAVIYLNGHSGDGKFTQNYQSTMVSLAQKGYVVLAPDEMGAGERRFTRQDQPHPYLTGNNPGGWQIWDAIRGVDYLVSRKDIVDPSRIGATGRSGGGFQTFYLTAIDERVACAAPVMYVSSFAGLIATHKTHTLDNYITSPRKFFEQKHLLGLIAPRPVFLGVGTDDIFPIDAVKATYGKGKELYGFYGKAENLEMHEVNIGHKDTLVHREKVYAFFNKNFGVGESAKEGHVQPASPADLEVGTPASSTADLWSLTYDQARRISRPKLATLKELQDGLKGLMGWDVYENRALGIPVNLLGIKKSNGLVTENLMLETEPGIYLAAELHYQDPDLAKKPRPTIACIGGLAQDKVAGMIAEGVNVLVFSPRIGGNFNDRQRDKVDMEYLSFCKSIFLGKPLFGQKVYDITRMVDYLTTRKGIVDIEQIGLMSIGETASATHALFSAFMDERVKIILVDQPLASFMPAGPSAENWANWPYATYLPKVLQLMDIAEGIGFLSPRPLMLTQPMGVDGQVLSVSRQGQVFGQAKTVYGKNKSQPIKTAFVVKSSFDWLEYLSFLNQWVIGHF